MDSNCTYIKYAPNLEGQYCGAISVDINGVKPPNMVGKDVFSFEINK